MPESLRGIPSPERNKVNGVITVYRFNLLDLEIWIKVSKHPFPKWFGRKKIVHPDEPLFFELVEYDGSPLEKDYLRAMRNTRNSEMVELIRRKNEYMRFRARHPEE
jgi:hypothetical protein